MRLTHIEGSSRLAHRSPPVSPRLDAPESHAFGETDSIRALPPRTECAGLNVCPFAPAVDTLTPLAPDLPQQIVV
jgi:hypothetical protein